MVKIGQLNACSRVLSMQLDVAFLHVKIKLEVVELSSNCLVLLESSVVTSLRLEYFRLVETMTNLNKITCMYL